MRIHVKGIYNISGSDFKCTKKWLCGFAGRRNISLRRRNNKKSKTALERMPKVKRWFARLRRRLRHGPHGAKAVKLLAAPRLDQDLFAKAHRGNDGRLLVSRQGTEGGQADCLVCAINNLMGGRVVDFIKCAEIAENLEDQEEREEARFDPVFSTSPIPDPRNKKYRMTEVEIGWGKMGWG